MRKKILIFGSLIFIAGALFYYLSTLEKNYPLPYYFTENTLPSLELMDDEREIQILIIGDSSAQTLFRYREMLSEAMSEDLLKRINVALLTPSPGEGLHRTLNKLRQLNPLPPVIIYQGSGEEEVEYRFATKDGKKILNNFKKAKDPYLATLLHFFPWTSPFIFKNHELVPLSQKIKNTTFHLKDDALMQRIPIHYQLYAYELKELVDFVRKKNKNILLITSPINHDTPPQKTCAPAKSSETETLIERVKSLIKEKDLKQAYSELKQNLDIIQSHAGLLFLMSKICLSTGNKEEAIKYAQLADSQECGRWRSNSVYNQIMRNVSQEEEIPLFDFAKIIEAEWGNNTTFIDKTIVQPLYYERAMKNIGEYLRKQLGY